MAFPLTVAQFKEHVSTSLGDDAIGRLLDDAEAAIIERAGPLIDGYLVTDMTERFKPHGDAILLSRRAEAIVEVKEHAQRVTPTTLAADDYALSSTGMVLRRVRGGTHPATYWHADVDVTYVPYSDDAIRVICQLELCRLEIAFSPGLASQTIGAWAEQYTTSGIPYPEQREGILARLHADPVVMY